MHVKPVLLDCNFVVDSTNVDGLGIRNLKGPCIANVYMNTSATPAAGNPNPEAGVIVVQFNDNYTRYLSGFASFVGPLGASTSSSVSAGAPYVVASLGTTTAAQWETAGIPSQMLNSTTGLPNVGLSFIATPTAAIGGTGLVLPPLSTGAGIDHIEIVGDPQQSIAPNPTIQAGGQLIMACYKNTALTAPANGTVISLSFYLSDSSVTVQGE